MSQNPVEAIPIVYTVRGCDACVKLLRKWDAEGVAYDERRVELSQDVVDEARKYGRAVWSRLSCGPTARSNKGLETASGALFEKVVSSIRMSRQAT
jgi:hypothetical protein